MTLLWTEVKLLLGVNAALWLWVLLVPPRIVRVRWLPSGALGLALPGLVLLTTVGDCRAVLRHELTHHLQMRRWSPLGVALQLGWHYLLRPLLQWVRGGDLPSFHDLYRTCPLEQEANAAMLFSRWPLRVWGRIPDL